MGTLKHVSFGWLTPALSYVMACAGAALGLRCTLRGLAASGAARRNWLVTAAGAIGSGIWTMHFVAMFGFTVDGTELRYSVPLTVLSLVVAVLVTGLGLAVVCYGRHRGPALLVGGVTTGLGIAAMHYLGMAAVRMHGGMRYDAGTVALSVLVAVGAATAALWAAVSIRNVYAAVAASLAMGLAVSCMHYTGMAAVHVRLDPDRAGLGGVGPMEFVFPLAVGLGSFLFLASAFVALSPTAQERAGYREAGELALEEFPTRPTYQPGGEGGELPRRVRQASLAPQLREAPARPDPGARRGGPAPLGGRSPEAVRAAMSAFQSGWARGSRPSGHAAERPHRRTEFDAASGPGRGSGHRPDGGSDDRFQHPHRTEGETS